MSLWHCTACSTAYAVGLPACPHCRSTSKEEDGMPKITKAGGPSHEGDPVAEPAPVVEPGAAPVAAVEPEPAAEQPKPKRSGRGRG